LRLRETQRKKWTRLAFEGSDLPDERQQLFVGGRRDTDFLRISFGGDSAPVFQLNVDEPLVNVIT